MWTIVNLPGEGPQYRIGRSNRCLSLLPCSVRIWRSDLFCFLLPALYFVTRFPHLWRLGLAGRFIQPLLWSFSPAAHQLIRRSCLYLWLVLSCAASLLCKCQVPHLPHSDVFPGSSLFLWGKACNFFLLLFLFFGKGLCWSYSALWV